MVQVPIYFTISELTRTSTGLPNFPSEWSQVESLRELALFLDSIRHEYGKPIRVNCAYRSPAVNAKVGGVATSAHLKGMAADICAASCREGDNRELLSILERNIGCIDQLISYHVVAGDGSKAIRFIHVGLSPAPRGNRLFK